ncbi:autophagy-related protein 22-like protein [Globomyces pollinis-pini]|nr:autophagy-related protein 22-like protein [Globomyces pollinis-pini]
MQEKESIDTITESTSYQMDQSPVTPAELNGWYSFGIAAEAYTYVAVGVFYPIILQSLAAHVGVERSDHSKPCNVDGAYKCDVSIMGIYIDTASLVLFATTISVILQLFLFTTLGSLADFGSHRKEFLVFFSLTSSIVGFGMIFVVNESLYWIAFLIYIISNTFYGASFVFCYAWLPLLTRYSPEVLEAHANPELSKESKYLVSDAISNKISATGFFLAYCSAVVQLFIVVTLVAVMGSGTQWGLPENYPMQIGIALVCVWQGVVVLGYTNTHLKTRPGPPLPENVNVVLFSLKNLYHTLSNARKQPELFKFLIFWFFYADAFSTVGASAILFAQSELGAGNDILITCAIIVPIFAGLGTLLWVKIKSTFHLTTQQVLKTHCLLFCLPPLWGLLGFLTPENSFGLQNKYELPIMGALIGLIIGATQSSSRVLFSELVPAGREAEFFGLYGKMTIELICIEITDKGSAWFGPLMVATVTTLTGEMRWGFLFVLFLFVCTFFVMSSIDVPKGKKEALQFSRVEKVITRIL